MEINQQKNLISSLEGISRAAAGICLDFQKLADSENDINDISEFLGITREQAVFFSCLSELSFQKTVTIEALARHFGCSPLKMVTMLGDIEALEKKGFVQKIIRSNGRKYSYNDFGFNVPHNVIEALRKSDSSLLETSVKFDLPGFLKQISEIIDERQKRNLQTSNAMEEVEFLIANNLSLPFVAYADTSLKSTISKCTLFCISYVRLKGQFTVNLDRFSDTLFDDLLQQLEFCQEVTAGTHELVKCGMLKSAGTEFDGDRTIMLEHKAAKVLYRDYPALLIPDPSARGAISFHSLKSKKLYYPGELTSQVKAIENVLMPSRFRNYRKALERNGLSKGVTAIFYGAPGTGKTETVYQLAKKTGRDICMVELSQTKSKWFGESEKRVRQIFVDYAEMLRNCDREPILFINEADGLFSKRGNVGGNSSSSDHTVNTMQNILLQCLEDFEGILVATTNLNGNLDKAFERRFAFRLEFPKPDSQVRQNIWRSKVPQLSDEDAARLGAKYDMTGGEIDVHVRQVLLKKVLDRRINLYEALEVSCSNDNGFTSKRKIGF